MRQDYVDAIVEMGPYIDPMSFALLLGQVLAGDPLEDAGPGVGREGPRVGGGEPGALLLE